MNKGLIWFFLVTSAIATLAVVLVAFLPIAGPSSSSNSFDADRWRNGSQHDRALMEHDLRNRSLLIGMHKDQALALLGPADDEGPKSFSYDCRPKDGLVTAGWMFVFEVEFDRDGLITKTSTRD